MTHEPCVVEGHNREALQLEDPKASGRIAGYSNLGPERNQVLTDPMVNYRWDRVLANS